MAEIITLQSAIVPILQKAAQKIADKYAGIRADDTNWMVHCPLHDDKQASCHIQVTDKLLVYCHVCGKDKQKDLVDLLKKEDLWVTIESPKKSEPQDGPQTIIPAPDIPEVFPRFMSIQGTNHPISKWWTYYTETGQPAFWIGRSDHTDAIGKTHKSVMPFSYFMIDGEVKFKAGLQHSARPLYNLPELINNPNKTVLVVEGEKTADAAKALFPDYVVTAWSGGVNGFKNTNISHLINRDVILWPDNDGPGIKAMKTMASFMPKAKIVFQEPQNYLPEKWDLADKVPVDVDLMKMLLGAETPILLTPESGVALTLDYFKSRLQKMEYNNDTIYVDILSRDHNRDPRQPFTIHGTLTALYKAFPQFNVEFVDGKVKKVRAVDIYVDDASQQIAHGITFDPTTTDVLVYKGKILYINTFMGFEHEPKECEPALYQPFLDHVNGMLGEKCAKWLLDFFADMVQNISRKPGVMPLLTGKPGTGKSIVGEVISSMLGRRVAGCIQCGAVIDSKFNGQLAHKLFVSLDEVNLYGAHNKNANENLKTLVTDRYMNVNEKFKQQYSEESHLRLMGTSNSTLPVHIDMSDRRYAVFKASDTFLRNREHFKKLVALMLDAPALCGLHHYFKTRKIETDIYDVPETDARTLIQKPEDPIIGTVFSMLNDAVLPEEIRRRLKDCQWPQKDVMFARSFLNKYIEKKHPSLTGARLTATLLSYFKILDEKRANNTIQLEYYTERGDGIEKIRERMYYLSPIEEQRKIYEQVTGTKPAWSEIAFGDEEEEQLDLKEVAKEPF